MLILDLKEASGGELLVHVLYFVCAIACDCVVSNLSQLLHGLPEYLMICFNFKMNYDCWMRLCPRPIA